VDNGEGAAKKAAAEQKAAAADKQKAADDKSKAETVKPPANEKEYVAYAEGWIDALTDNGDARWTSEKAMRNKANVGSDARETLQERLAKKNADIRAANEH
jgi:hypothetical protein